MTGFDAQKYEQAKIRAEDVGFTLQIIGDTFSLDGYSRFPDIDAVLYYLYGYEKGKGEKS